MDRAKARAWRNRDILELELDYVAKHKLINFETCLRYSFARVHCALGPGDGSPSSPSNLLNTIQPAGGSTQKYEIKIK
jgi:hypothetical protein